MSNFVLGKILIALTFLLPAQAMAGVNVDINIALPPPVIFAAPPALVVLPETYVYVVPDSDVDIFFYSGWWWRPWEGRWYRSRDYNSGWRYYRRVPSFYVWIPSEWRNDYRAHRWRGHQWDYQPIPHQQVQRNWRGWEKNKHWEKQNSWGVRGLKPQVQSKPSPKAIGPQPSRLQPQSKPDVREPARQQQSRPQPRDIQSQQPRPQSQPRPEVRETNRPQPSRPEPQDVRQQHSQPQQQRGQQSDFRKGKPERGQEEKQDRKQHDR
ncbi:MAG: hypothetical protein CVU71_09380 [Deltaproteobacteria bacterium HGW-Deltaproteobacteria-6]|nr:MAG: hypothetical protein CVU71_09380 [Deltaproteobacteria bacterium HGW-Deltaproteobacteria-6]